MNTDVDATASIKVTKSETKEALQKGVVEIVFTKKDGTERVLIGTLNGTYIPPEDWPTGEGHPNYPNEDVQAVYDLENSGWRSFRWDSVTFVDDKYFTD